MAKRLNKPIKVPEGGENKQDQIKQVVGPIILLAITGKSPNKKEEINILQKLHKNPELYDSIQHPPKYLLKHIANYLRQKSDKWSDCVCNGTIDIDSDHGVMSCTNGTVKLGQVCEYGNDVIVWYNGKEQREHIVYRAARHDSSRDNRGLCFDKTKIISIKEENNNVAIIVEASSKTERRTYRFSFSKTSLPKEVESSTPQQKEALSKAQDSINESVKWFDSSYKKYTEFCSARSWGFREAVSYISGMESSCGSILSELKQFKINLPENVGGFNELDQVRKYIIEKIKYLQRNVNPMADSGGRLFDKYFSKEIVDGFSK